MHCVPRTASSSLSSGPSPARPPCRSSPLLSPHPSLPSENPASWVVAWTERSGGGRPQQDGYDLGHGNRDPRVLAPWPWLASSSSCVLVCAGTVGLEFGFPFGFFFFFFLLILASFSKMGIDQNCSVYAWNWMERLWNSCWGGGGHQQPNRRAVSGPVFIFKNRQMRQWSLSPPRRGDSWPPSPHYPH